jgi:hypothetical protein
MSEALDFGFEISDIGLMKGILAVLSFDYPLWLTVP